MLLSAPPRSRSASTGPEEPRKKKKQHNAGRVDQLYFLLPLFIAIIIINCSLLLFNYREGNFCTKVLQPITDGQMFF